MSFGGNLLKALQSIDGIAALKRGGTLSAKNPSFEVETDGYEFEGKVLKQRCVVRLWTGTDDDPLAEAMFERFAEQLLSTLFEHELTRDCMSLVSGFDRLPPANPQGYKTEFVAGQITVREA